MVPVSLRGHLPTGTQMVPVIAQFGSCNVYQSMLELFLYEFWFFFRNFYEWRELLLLPLTPSSTPGVTRAATCVSMSLCPHWQSEIGGREAHHLFNLSFLYFPDELASFQWACPVADELVVGVTHNIFHAHDNKRFMSPLIVLITLTK